MTTRRQKRFEAKARAANCAMTLRSKTSSSALPGRDRNPFLKLSSCDWIRQHRSLLLIGPAGVGKCWLACALGHKACREDLSIAYHRVPRLFAALALARGDGRYTRLIKSLPRTDLLVLDDWEPEKPTTKRQAFMGEAVDNGQDTEPSPIGEGIADEVVAALAIST